MSPDAGERGSCGVQPMCSVYSCAHGAQRNFGNITPYLTYGLTLLLLKKKFSSKKWNF
jgi:hypothetical protein